MSADQAKQFLNDVVDLVAEYGATVDEETAPINQPPTFRFPDGSSLTLTDSDLNEEREF